MNPDRLEEELSLWGHIYGEKGKHDAVEDRSPTGNSPLSNYINTERRVKDSVAGRDGIGRRRLMGAAAGVKVLDPAYIDPIPCSETRAKQSKAPPDPRSTFLVERIQGHWLYLHGCFPLQAECVRLQYQVRGLTQKDKSKMITLKDGKPMGTKRFKDELRAGKHWLHARLTGTS